MVWWNEGVTVALLYALMTQVKVTSGKDLKVHRKTPSSCLHWNYCLLSPVELSTEMTGEASHSCVLKQYSCYLHIAPCKSVIIDIFICVYMHVCIGSRNRHALVTQTRIQKLDRFAIQFFWLGLTVKEIMKLGNAEIKH